MAGDVVVDGLNRVHIPALRDVGDRQRLERSDIVRIGPEDFVRRASRAIEVPKPGPKQRILQQQFRRSYCRKATIEAGTEFG
jgi:hypothetical protein